MPDVIKSFDGDYFFLSNFFPCLVEINILGDRMRFPSGEHAFQACKAWFVKDEQKAHEYAFGLTSDGVSPSKAKLAGRKVKIDPSAWDLAKDDFMRQVVFSKFMINADICGQLLQTGTVMLVEGNTWGDTYWGRTEGKGLNRLGAILMEVRGYWIYTAKVDVDLCPVPEQYVDILMGW